MAEIMGYEEYLRSPKKELPYVMQIGQPPHVLTYVGVQHSFDLTHPQFPKIKALWEAFVATVDPTNAVAFTEARVRQITTSEEDGITHAGESGLVSYLGYKAGIPVACPEPDDQIEYAALLKQFSVDDILFYYTERVVAQYFRTPMTQPVEDYVDRYMARDKQKYGPATEHFTWEYFKKMMPDYGVTSFDPSTAEQWLQLGNPTINGTQSNRVARASSILRDQHIANQIIQKFNSGTSIFAVYGSTHVVMQESYLRTYLEPSKENQSPSSS